MLDELRCRENVQNRRLGTWLTEEEYRSFESDWESQLQIREELKDKPDKPKCYEDKATKLHNLSNTLCEAALEILQEIVAADASLQI